MNGIKLLILPDRTNVAFVDLIIAGRKTTIAYENCTSDFLVEHHTHLSLKPRDYIEIGDVNHIIPIELLLLINSSGSGGTLKQREYFFLLKLTLHVTLCTSLVLSNIRKCRLNTRERSVTYRAHYTGYPTSITLNELGRVVKSLSFGEQPVNALNTIFLRMGKETFLKRTITLTISNNGVHSIVSKSVLLILIFVVKYVVLHFFISSFIIFGFRIAHNLSDYCIHSGLLLIGESIKYIADSLIIIVFSHGLLFLL